MSFIYLFQAYLLENLQSNKNNFWINLTSNENNGLQFYMPTNNSLEFNKATENTNQVSMSINSSLLVDQQQ